MRGLRSVVLAVLVSGIAADAAAQTSPPAFVREGKAWFKVVEGASGKPFDDFSWQPPAGDLRDCVRFGALAPSVGIRYDTFQKGAGGPGTFTLDTCSLPISNSPLEQVPGGRDPWSVLVQVPAGAVSPTPTNVEDEYVTLRTVEWRRDPFESMFLFMLGKRSGLTPDATFSTETLTFKRNGQLLGTEPGDTTASELNDLFDMTYDEESAGAELEGSIRLGRTPFASSAARRCAWRVPSTCVANTSARPRARPSPSAWVRAGGGAKPGDARSEGQRAQMVQGPLSSLPSRRSATLATAIHYRGATSVGRACSATMAQP